MDGRHCPVAALGVGLADLSERVDLFAEILDRVRTDFSVSVARGSHREKNPAVGPGPPMVTEINATQRCDATVTLDVGGTVYRTHRETLSTVADTMLAVLVSGAGHRR